MTNHSFRAGLGFAVVSLECSKYVHPRALTSQSGKQQLVGGATCVPSPEREMPHNPPPPFVVLLLQLGTYYTPARRVGKRGSNIKDDVSPSFPNF